MATSEQHQAKWQHNRRFLATIESGFPDWMVTAAFYTAVHAVECLFARDRLPNHYSHMARNQTLKRLSRYRPIWLHFRPLYVTSQVARYLVTSKDWISHAEARELFVLKHLAGVEIAVLSIGKLNLMLDPLMCR